MTPRCRAVDLADAPEPVRARAEELLEAEGLHHLGDGYWLLCGPLQRTAGHRYELATEGGEVVVDHVPPEAGGVHAQVLTRPRLLFQAEWARPGQFAVRVREPGGGERRYGSRD